MVALNGSMMAGLYVTVVDPERAALFEAVFGARTVPIENRPPEMCNLIPLGVKPCFKLDFERLTAAQVTLLVKHFAEKHGIDRDAVSADIRAAGLPIMASDVIVHHGPDCPRSAKRLPGM